MIPLKPTADPTLATFETPTLRGTLCAEGEFHGYRELEFVETGAKPANPRLYLGHVYRTLSDGECHAVCRQLPHTGAIEGDRAVVRWEPSETMPGGVAAVYQVSGENTLDFTITVTASAPMKRYELYLSNYFSAAWRPYVYLQSPAFLRSPEPVLWGCEVNEFIRGMYLAFPRDKEATLTLFDGRWHGAHPVPFAVGKCHHTPIGIFASALDRLAVIATARREECTCLYTTYDAPDARDNILHHNAFYFGMFNEDLSPGDVRTAHVRYHFVSWDTVDDLPLRLQAAFEED